jgi:hypothetical protein
MRAKPLLLFLFCLSLSGAQASKSPQAPKPFPIAVGQPAFIGEPIWVSEITRPNEYSYVTSECIHLELLYDGKPVPGWSLKPVFGGFGGSSSLDMSFMSASDCLPTAIRNPPFGKRLPLHAWFQIRQPGRYALRWTNLGRVVKDGKSVTTQVSSAWITFTVQPSSAADRERWLSHLLARPPDHASEVIGDYIPALVAAAPDERALQAIAARLFSFNDLMAESAAEALAFFPEDHVRSAIYELIQKQGPTDFLAHMVSWNSLGLGADANQRAQMTRTCFGYLHSSDPEKVAAAIVMILFNVHGKNPTPTDPKLVAQADDEVLNATADIAETGQQGPQRELMRYVSCIESPEGRRRLVSMAHSESAVSNIANAALIYDHSPEANGPLLLEVKEHDEMPHGVITARSYGVTITNLTGSVVTIERSIAIESKTPKGWKQNNGIQAVATCRDRRYHSKLPIRFAHCLTTCQTAFSVMLSPQMRPILFTFRKIRPCSIWAALSQLFNSAMTQSGIGTVRTCPPLPDRSTIAQCSSRC